MRYVLLLEGVVIAAIGAYLLWPDATPPAATAITAAAAAPMGFDDYAWQASMIAIKALPLLLIVCLVYLLIRVLPRALERHHQVALVRAQRQAPEHVTSYSPHVTYSPRYPAQALPRTLPMLEATARPLPLNEWYPTCVQHLAHVLIVGETQSGKSMLARALLTARATTDQVVVIDPHAKFNDWLGVPVYGFGRNIDEAVHAIIAIHAEFERRFQGGEAVDTGLTVFIDEFPALCELRKEIVPLVKQWLREAAKARIRLVMLTQEPNAKTLGVEGEAAIKQNFLHVLLGSYAVKAQPLTASLPRPAVLLRADQDPRPLDVTGLPALIHDDVPPVAVWQPTATSSSLAMQEIVSPYMPIQPKKKKKTELTEAQKIEIRTRKQSGEKKSYVCRDMFGTTGGDVWYAFAEVWDEAAA